MARATYAGGGQNILTQLLTRKAIRKMRRHFENEVYAEEARFWIGKIRSADRLGYKVPVNGLAKKQMKKDRHKEEVRKELDRWHSSVGRAPYS